MKKIELLSNLPQKELKRETDYLGLIDKADLIKAFLENNSAQFSEIKMFALFGEWGSGKSSLMYYLKKQLKEIFNTFFFDTWEFESDANLPLSLMEFMIGKGRDSTDQALGEIMKGAEKLFKGFIKSVKVSFPFHLINIDINGEKLMEEAEAKDEKTFFELKKDFKTKFIRFEDEITNEKKKYNIVFIDDLDRCEPENVLHLLTAIKLFFTYGKKTIFFFGLDKKAVEAAVKTKYKEVVKAEEYLEKIFDVSFTMPEHNDILKLINHYFDNREIEWNGSTVKLNEKIAKFFRELKFTNPRRLKKVLNKFLLLRNYKAILKKDEESKYYGLIPNIYCGEDGNYFETIICLYFIILHEFEKEILKDFSNFDLKKVNYTTKAMSKAGDIAMEKRRIKDQVDRYLQQYHITLISAQKKYKTIKDANRRREELAGLIALFSPHNPDDLVLGAFHSLEYYIKEFQISEKKIDYYFTLYLLKNIHIFTTSDDLSDYKLSTLEKMLKELL